MENRCRLVYASSAYTPEHAQPAMTRIASIQTAEFVLSCDDLSATQAFFTDDLGFLIESVLPADDPRTVVLSGYGVRLRLERGNGTAAALLRLVCGDPGAVAGGATELVAPNGTCIELVAAESRAVVPPLRGCSMAFGGRGVLA